MSGVATSFNLNPGCGYRRMASFMPLPCYSWLKSPRYPLNRKASGPQRWSGHIGEEKHFLSGIEPRFVGCRSLSLFNSAAGLLRLVVVVVVVVVGCAVVDKFDKLRFGFMYWTVRVKGKFYSMSVTPEDVQQNWS